MKILVGIGTHCTLTVTTIDDFGFLTGRVICIFRLIFERITEIFTIFATEIIMNEQVFCWFPFAFHLFFVTLQSHKKITLF